MTIEQGHEIEVLPARRPAQSEALGQLMAHAEAMSAAEHLGSALAGTDMVPKDYKGKPGNAAAAILYGAELGLNPIQSLQQIFVIHGSPAIYARTAVALVKRHGVVIETVTTSNEGVTVRGRDPRTGQVEQSTWDMGRATLAGYTSNAKYKTNPQEMLYAKAAMEVCRKIAPDVLLGIPYSREELELELQPQRVRSERGGRGVDGLRQALNASGENPEMLPADTDTEATNGEPPITKPQLQKLSILRQHAGYADTDEGRADWFQFVQLNIARLVGSNKELTKAEGTVLIDLLENPPQDEPA